MLPLERNFSDLLIPGTTMKRIDLSVSIDHIMCHCPYIHLSGRN